VSPSVLGEILAAKKERLARGEFAPEGRTPPRPSDGGRFLASLREPGPRIIAEIKRRSPSAGEIFPSLETSLETIALAYRRGHAAAISVVTEQDFFGGNPEWISRAKRISGLPILMKDFIVEERQLDFARELGADAVLLIASLLPGESMHLLVDAARARGLGVVAEAHTGEEIDRLALVAADVVGVNARDLSTFGVDLSAVEALASRIAPGRVRLAESGISSREDVERLERAGFTAFLVGETLLRAVDPEDRLRELRGARR
jgi:indole-3-glycerol phosphate synthase